MSDSEVCAAGAVVVNLPVSCGAQACVTKWDLHDHNAGDDGSECYLCP